MINIEIKSKEVKNPKCRHCGEVMLFVTEGKTCYLFMCDNKDCIAKGNGVEVPKTKLAEKLAN